MDYVPRQDNYTDPYTTAERVFIVKNFYKVKDYEKVKNEFSLVYGKRRTPTQYNIMEIVEQFEKTGNVTSTQQPQASNRRRELELKKDPHREL